MEGFHYVDLFATKGVEYILVIGFLVALIVYWRVLNKAAKRGVQSEARPAGALSRWFNLAKNLYYHPSHSWALPEEDNIVKVGIDDFAVK